MTPEEFQRIKDAEKAHLRALKQLKEQLRSAERLGKVSRALQDMEDAPGDDILRTHDEMIEKLALETVRHEVRLDSAITEASEARADADADAELQKMRAASLIRQVKLEMGLDLEDAKQDPPSNVAEPGAETTGHRASPEQPVNPTPPPKPPAEKTIGRLRK